MIIEFEGEPVRQIDCSLSTVKLNGEVEFFESGKETLVVYEDPRMCWLWNDEVSHDTAFLLCNSICEVFSIVILDSKSTTIFKPPHDTSYVVRMSLDIMKKFEVKVGDSFLMEQSE
jgi:hypothetical protein